MAQWPAQWSDLMAEFYIFLGGLASDFVLVFLLIFFLLLLPLPP